MEIKDQATKLKVIMIGPLPPPVGGARVLFKETVDYLSTSEQVTLRMLPLWSLEGSFLSKAIRGFVVFFSLLFSGSAADLISLWSSQDGMILFGPLVVLAGSFLKKPVVFRMFGVGYDKPIQDLGTIKKSLMNFIFSNADLVLLETELAVDLLKKEFPRANISAHANYRRIPPGAPPLREDCRRFVFLGRVHEVKGIEQIFQAVEGFDFPGLTVDVYGPLTGRISKDDFDRHQSVSYQGIVDPAEVPVLLEDYDALLLPSNYRGEGHPGVILEAYASGLPVIASDIGGIGEIVDESCGILVRPGNVGDLQKALEKLVKEPETYRSLARGVVLKREEYSISRGVERFLDYCRSVLQAAHQG